MKNKLKITEGKIYKSFNGHLVKIIKIEDKGERLTKIFDFSDNIREWIPLVRVEEKMVKLIR